jgi:hypothetical protein
MCGLLAADVSESADCLSIATHEHAWVASNVCTSTAHHTCRSVWAIGAADMFVPVHCWWYLHTDCPDVPLHAPGLCAACFPVCLCVFLSTARAYLPA